MRLDPAPWQTRRTKMICAVLSVIDAAFILATLGWGESNLVMDFLVWQARREAAVDGVDWDAP